MEEVIAPSGVWPAMITPLNMDQSIAWDRVDALTDWFIESGVAGLFAVGQSGEMFKLTNEERLALSRRVVERAAGRVPVVASGTFGGPIDQQAEFVKQMADTGVVAVTVIAGEMAEATDDEDVWIHNVEQLLNLTGDIPLALYECPEPYHRLISTKEVKWAAETGRFHLLKETSRSLDLVKAKVEAAAGSSLRVFNADTTGLLDSLKFGAKGYCGIAANFYPNLLAWLCANYDTKPEMIAQIQAVIQAADATIHLKYPVSAKYYRQYLGFDMNTISRVSDAKIEAYDRRVLHAIAALTEGVRHIVKD